MPKLAEALNVREVARLSDAGFHMVGGVPGLALAIKSEHGRSWVLRARVAGGKRRDIGLGPYPAVSLPQARDAAAEMRARIRQGADPVGERRAARVTAKAAQATAQTFRQCAAAYIAAHAGGWKNIKHGQQWRNTLEQHAYPVLGGLDIKDVALPHVLAVLEPIWATTTETAVRLRGRMESVLDWATVRGYREGLNPARWRGHLDKLLPKPAKVSKVEHHAALPVAAVGAFMTRLRAAPGMGARALEFVILTAARSGEVRGATWAEIDLDAAVWTVPGARMKAGKDHRVPLSPPAVALLKAVPRMVGVDLVFPAPRGGSLSDMTLTAVLRRLDVPAVPHGFRSTFRDWAAERTAYPGEMAEMALAHTVGDKVEAAYRRGDMLAKRAAMMAEWAAFLAVSEVAA